MAEIKNQHLGEASMFSLGRVVALKYEVQFGNGKQYGHVVGFSLNSNNEILVVVQLPTKCENNDSTGGYGGYIIKAYHPCNLSLIH